MRNVLASIAAAAWRVHVCEMLLQEIAADAWRVFCVWKMVLGRIAAGMESFSMQDVLARITDHGELVCVRKQMHENILSARLSCKNSRLWRVFVCEMVLQE